jgi:hypothetical protein
LLRRRQQLSESSPPTLQSNINTWQLQRSISRARIPLTRRAP